MTVFSFCILWPSAFVFAQTEQEDQQVAKLRAVMQAEEQFLAPLNQSLSAVAEENGSAIDESYTHFGSPEPYDYFFRNRFKDRWFFKTLFAGVFIAAPAAIIVSAFLKKRLAIIIPALGLASLPAFPPVFAFGYLSDVVWIAPDCEGNGIAGNCFAENLSSNPFYYATEVHYKLTSSGFTGSCLVFFTPDDFQLPIIREGYELTVSDPIVPLIESTKFDYRIESCTHKGVFSEQTNSEGYGVVATGSISRESPQ